MLQSFFFTFRKVLTDIYSPMNNLKSTIVIILLLTVTLMQAQRVMVLEKTDRTSSRIDISDVKYIYFEKADDKYSVEAARLLAYLRSIYGQKTIAGTMANVNWNTNEAQWVYRHTGKWPALNCFDYIHHLFSTE